VLIVIVGVSYLIRVPFLTFVKAVREPFLIAFTTASSEAALPKALEVMEQFGVPKNIVGFVLPTGYSFNLDGTTLYLSLASVFVAQLAGVPMTFGQQLVMMLTLMLTSKGVAGVPRAALVVLTATLTQFGLPLEGAAILLGSKYDSTPAERIVFTFAPQGDSVRVVAASMFVTNPGSAFEQITPINAGEGVDRTQATLQEIKQSLEVAAIPPPQADALPVKRGKPKAPLTLNSGPT